MIWPFRRERTATHRAETPLEREHESQNGPFRRIAVLGASGLDTRTERTSVRCFPWSYSGESSVVADFDVALVNLSDAGPQDDYIDLGLPKEVDGEVVLSLLSAVHRLIEAGGEVVVIGRPDVSCWGKSGLPGGGTAWSSNPRWTGLLLKWSLHAGDRVEPGDTSTEFEPYLERLTTYEYSLVRATGIDVYPPGPGYDPFGFPPDPIGVMNVESRALRRTRHGGLVASVHRVWSPLERDDPKPARVVLLPPIPDEPAGGVHFLLRNVYGVPIVTPDPPWLAELTAPGESEIQARIEAVRNDLANLQAKIGLLEEERAALRRSLRLVSEMGEQLEEAVRDAFRRLGATVEEPCEPNKEDGWITVHLPDRTCLGVLEIKSTRRNTFDESGLRQLLHWRDRSREAREAEFKGIFVGNSACGLPIAHRPDPFEHSFRATAAARGLVALSTSTLLSELRAVVEEGASANHFWRALFATDGVYEASA